MVQYNLRSADGILKAIIPSRVALEMFGASAGMWEKTPCGQRHILQFGGPVASCTAHSSDGPIILFFLSGDIIEITT